MALPRIYQKLFQNEGAGSVLRSDILPPAQSVAVADVTINNYSTAGEYIITGNKLASDGYPYDTSDPVYLKVIEAGDSVIQYFIHNDDIQIRYKGTDGNWSEWKSYEALIEAGDNELASQIQQLKVNANTLLGKITVVESSVASVESAVSAHTSDIAALKTTTSTNTANIATLKTDVSTNTANISALDGRVATNASDISSLDTRTTTAEGEIDTLQSDLTSLTGRVKTNEDDISGLKASVSTNTTNLSAAVTRIDDVTNWESTAQMHNNIYRGANLLDGHFSSIADIMTAVRAGNFSDIYVGDYIPASFSCSIDTSVTSTNFRIAAINLLNARSGAWGSTSPNLCIVPDKLGSAYMNSTNTSAGGYVGSYMYKTVLPAYYTALAGSSGKPFYGYIKTTTERLSNGIDTAKSCGGYSGWTGAVSSASNYTNQNLVLLNEPEVYGCKHWSSSEGDAETIAVQLPMFRLNPNTITNNGTLWWWLRAVAASPLFCYVGESLSAGCYGASGVTAVRPRFFIA